MSCTLILKSSAHWLAALQHISCIHTDRQLCMVFLVLRGVICMCQVNMHNISNMSIAFIGQTMPTCMHKIPTFMHSHANINMPSCKAQYIIMHAHVLYHAVSQTCMHNISSCKHNMLTCMHNMPTWHMHTQNAKLYLQYANMRTQHTNMWNRNVAHAYTFVRLCTNLKSVYLTQAWVHPLCYRKSRCRISLIITYSMPSWWLQQYVQLHTLKFML